MNIPILELMQTPEGWQAVFAFQVFHRPPEEWMKMRWGFNAGALLDEALDRYKLFIESQAVNENDFHAGTVQNNMLVLRGIHSPESGLKMVLLGKSCASNSEEAQQAAEQYACQVFSTFPHDFLLVPIKPDSDYHHICGEYLLDGNSDIVQIQRGVLSLPKRSDSHTLLGLWQSSSRSNEQIWRALSGMPQPALFNITITPSMLLPHEKHLLEGVKKNISEQKDDAIFACIPWIENYTKRRLATWKKFFLVQVHLVTEGGVQNLIRSIGSALTRDSNDLTLPGYQARYPAPSEKRQWCESIRSLDLVENSSRLDDLADLDEVYSIFRFPYRPEAGLPGANFNEIEKKIDSSLG
jgi:hypothetical protein